MGDRPSWPCFPPSGRLLSVVLAAGVGVLVQAVGARADGLRVIPFPGTPDAARQTRVIFSSLDRSQLRGVTVAGARSGPHGGHLITLPDGAGTAFVPSHPFAAGELVRVRAGLRSASAGQAAGTGGATTLAFSFTTALPSTGAGPTAAQTPPEGASSRWGQTAPSGRAQHFQSQSFAPPAVTVSSAGDTNAGDIFLTPQGGPQTGAMILNPGGGLVWFLPTSTQERPFNLQVQRYLGRPVLTFWQGRIVDFHGVGHDVIMDSSYRPLATIQAGNGYQADLHEFQLTPQGTALIDAYVPVRADLSSVGGSSNGRVYDCVIQEVDIRTGQVLWEWHSLGHIPISASYRGKPSSRVYQYLHLNSIQQLPGGNLLISGRNTWAIYKINKQDGHIIWTLGGKHSTFTMGPGTGFEWQHDAHLYGSLVTLLDDADNPQEEKQSTAKVLGVNTQSGRVSLIHSYGHSPALLTPSQGNAQLLPDGNMFVGWGAEPVFSEYTPAGRQILDGRLPLGITSYRAYRFSWTGQPVTPPSLAVAASGQDVSLYASWNGANRVAIWRILGGNSPSSLSYLDRVYKKGQFETAVTLRSSLRYFAVQALDSHHNVLGTSPVQAR